MLKGFKFTSSVITEMWKIQWVKETTSFLEGFIEAQLNILKWLCTHEPSGVKELYIYNV